MNLKRSIFLFISVISIFSLNAENALSQASGTSVPSFLKRYVDENGQAKALSPQHKKWMLEESNRQLQAMRSGSSDKKKALLNQANESLSVCDGFKSFDPKFTTEEWQDCRKQMTEVQNFLTKEINEMTEAEIDDAYAIALKRLEVSAQGKELSVKEEIDLFQSTNSFQTEYAKLSKEDQAKFRELMDLYNDPKFVEALQNKDKDTLQKILKSKSIELPPGFLE